MAYPQPGQGLGQGSAPGQGPDEVTTTALNSIDGSQWNSNNDNMIGGILGMNNSVGNSSLQSMSTLGRVKSVDEDDDEEREG